MKINNSQHIKKPPEDVFRIVSDFKYWLEKADPDVVSVIKQTDGPIGVGTKWIESLKVPMSTVNVDLWITGTDPGKSMDVEFSSNAMKGTGAFTFTPNDGDTDVLMDVHASVRPGLGWLMYPMIRMDFPKRERNRLAAVKSLIEPGELEATGAEAPAGTGEVSEPAAGE